MYGGKKIEEGPQIGCIDEAYDAGDKHVSPLRTGGQGGVWVHVRNVADHAEEIHGAHGNVEHSQGIQATVHEVHMVDAPTVGGTTVGVDSGVGGINKEVSVTAGDDEGEKGGSLRQCHSRHSVIADDDVSRTVELGARNMCTLQTVWPCIPMEGEKHRRAPRLICVGRKHLEHMY